MPEFVKILDFNNVNENDGIEEFRTYIGHQESLVKIELGSERTEGRGKEFVKVKLQDGETEHEVGTFVAKKFPRKEDALTEIKKCWYLGNKGIPVPPTHRYVEQDGQFYVVYTDLTEGGKNEVWSTNNLLEENKRPTLNQEQFEEVAYQMKSIAETAAAYDYTIKEDAYFIIKTPDEKVYVILGDFGVGVSAYPVSSESNDCFKDNVEEVEHLLECVKEEKVTQQ
jgi:hypothetical protein